MSTGHLNVSFHFNLIHPLDSGIQIKNAIFIRKRGTVKEETGRTGKKKHCRMLKPPVLHQKQIAKFDMASLAVTEH